MRSAIRCPRAEALQRAAARVLRCALKLCRRLDALAGRRRRRTWGSSEVGLDSPFAARLASSSARSFPSMPSWPGVRRRVSLTMYLRHALQIRFKQTILYWCNSLIQTNA